MAIPKTTLDSFKDKDAFAYIDVNSKDGSIKATKLDDFILENNIGNVDVVKIDIEGAELLCFKGASSFLEKHRPIILFEGYEKNCRRFDYSLMELLEHIRTYNYELTQINSETWLAKPI